MQGELLLKGRQKMDALEESMGVTRQALKEKISLKPDYPAVLVELEKKRAAIMADINNR